MFKSRCWKYYAWMGMYRQLKSTEVAERIMRHCCKSDHSAVIIIITMMEFLIMPMMSDSSRQRNNQASYGRDRQRYEQTNNDVIQPDSDYYYDDQSSCDIEVTCTTETEDALPPTSMKLPIRGPKGPPGEPGRPGRDGIPALPGLPGKSFNSIRPNYCRYAIILYAALRLSNRTRYALHNRYVRPSVSQSVCLSVYLSRACHQL